MAANDRAVTRRAAMGIAAGLASGSALALLASCAAPTPPPAPSSASPPPPPPPPGRPQPTAPIAPIAVETPPQAPVLARIPAPSEAITALPGDGQLLAWTVDDGASSAVVAAYAAFAAETGTRLTLFATGTYDAWRENQPALQPLVSSGQVQLANHTWSHPDLTELSDAGIRDELQRTHDLLGELYGVDARPFYRPPYGYSDDRVIDVAASIGYTTPTLWYGSLSDSGLISESLIVELATQWFLPQHIVIGHLNFDPVTRVFPQLHALIEERGLTTVTLNDVFSSEWHP